MSLAIKKNSWHYKLHTVIRSAWGWEPSPDEHWSLCPYFHTTLWGTLLTTIAAPFALAGWLLCKVLRKMYKIGENHLALRWFSNLCDRIPLGSFLESAPDRFTTAPIPEGVLWFIICLISAAVTTVVAYAIGLFAYHGLGIIPMIPEALWYFARVIGWLFFEFMGFVGLCLKGLVYAVIVSSAWLLEAVIFLASWIWGVGTSAKVWSFIGFWAGFALVAAACSTVVAMLGIKTITSNAAKRIWAWAEMKANGYSEARSRRKEKTKEDFIKSSTVKVSLNVNETKRVDKMKSTYGDDWIYFVPKKLGGKYNPKDKQERKWMMERQAEIRQYKNPTVSTEVKDSTVSLWKGFKFLWRRSWRFIIGLYGRNEYKVEQIKSPDGDTYEDTRKVFVLGPIGILVSILWAFKKGICPLLEFVNESDLEDEEIVPETQSEDNEDDE